jgi:hypothetical protein
MPEAAPSSVVDAVVILAQAKGETDGRTWLLTELERVTLAMMAGAETVKSLSFQGGTMTGENEVECVYLVDLVKRALNQFDHENGDEDNDSAARSATLIPRFTCIPH